MLRELAPDLWVSERSLVFGGIDLGARMTVIRLRDGELFLHSPVSLDPELRAELDALGAVRFVVAPNRMHHLFIGEYADAYPRAELFAAPGLETKRKDLAWQGVLGDEAPPAWAGQIDQLFFRGFPLANEVVFFHPPSRTLLLTDLAFNIRSDSPKGTRVLFRLLGAYDRFGPSLLERVLIRDRSAGRASLQGILAWDFDRVIMAHGQVLAKGGRDALRAGYAWLL